VCLHGACWQLRVLAAPRARTILQLCEPFALSNASASLRADGDGADDDEADVKVGRVDPKRLAVLGGACERRA